MNDTFIWKTNRPWPNDRMKQASIVGHTTAKSTLLWLRTAKPGKYTLLVFEVAKVTQTFTDSLKLVPFSIDTLPNSIKKYPFTIENYDNDTIHVEKIENLKPLTKYGYALYGDDLEVSRIMLGQDRVYQFRTLSNTKTKDFSFAFYSCHMPYKDTIFGNTNIQNLDMWDYFNLVLEKQSEQMRFVIGGGDQVYVDGVKSLNIWRYLTKVARVEQGELLPSVEAMKTWYRDIYRGYWGFENVKKMFSSYPNYMIWDDHELSDGWGSFIFSDKSKEDELNEMFDWKLKGLKRTQANELLERMQKAAFCVYNEYQHSHNPGTKTNEFHYHSEAEGSAFYFLDGRSQRDINRSSRKVLGRKQYLEFIDYLKSLNPKKTPFLFVTSAVPLMHMNTVLANADDNILADLSDLQDDLRDSWEHKSHDSERKGLLKALFEASARGIRICILSGDVHTSAVFKMTDKKTGAMIYQLTSSAITYNKPRALSWILGKTVADKGHSKDGYSFERLLLYTQSNFSIIRVLPKEKTVWFDLYGKQTVEDPNYNEEEKPIINSLANIELFSNFK